MKRTTALALMILVGCVAAAYLHGYGRGFRAASCECADHTADLAACERAVEILTECVENCDAELQRGKDGG
jgi:hypothetical protein